MARASRELAITRLAQHAAQRLLGDDDTEFLENPLAEIDDPPAHDPVNRRDWAALDDRGERGAMRPVQPRRLPWRLAVDQAVRALRVELDHPVANDLQPDAPDLRRRPQPTRAIIIPKTNCCRHGEPPAIRPVQQISADSGIPLRESASAGTGITRQTPSVRMTKSAGSKTWPLTKSSTF